MATRSLRELIRASGNAGTAGQSFRNHVTGAVTGARMSEYVMLSTAWSGSQPQPPGEITYAGTVDFGLTFTATANSRFVNIRNALQAAWSLYTLSGNGTATVSWQGFSWSGLVLSATVRVTAPVAGTGATITSSAAFVSGTPSAGDPESVQFRVDASGGGGSTQDFTIRADWQPVPSLWEDLVTTAWPVRWTQRAYGNADILVEWFHSASDRDAGTNRVGTGNTHIPGSVPPYPSNASGTLPGESATMYARWAYATAPTSWTGVTITFTDPRPPL